MGLKTSFGQSRDFLSGKRAKLKPFAAPAPFPFHPINSIVPNGNHPYPIPLDFCPSNLPTTARLQTVTNFVSLLDIAPLSLLFSKVFALPLLLYKLLYLFFHATLLFSYSHLALGHPHADCTKDSNFDFRLSPFFRLPFPHKKIDNLCVLLPSFKIQFGRGRKK